MEKMTKTELMEALEVYRNELKRAGEILRQYAEENFADNARHKIISAYEYSQISLFVDDINDALTLYRIEKDMDAWEKRLKEKRGK